MDYGFLIIDNGLLRVRNPFSRVRNPRLQREARLSSFAKRCRSLVFLSKMTSIPYLYLAKLPVQNFLHETHVVRLRQQTSDVTYCHSVGVSGSALLT